MSDLDPTPRELGKNVLFTVELDSELRDALVGAARNADCTAPQLIRELMKDFIAEHTPETGYDEFPRQKVENARASFREGSTATYGGCDRLTWTARWWAR